MLKRECLYYCTSKVNFDNHIKISVNFALVYAVRRIPDLRLHTRKIFTFIIFWLKGLTIIIVW